MTRQKSIIQKCVHVCHEPEVLMERVMERFPSRFDDERYLKALYKRIFGKELRLDNPVTMNEKLNWLKLNDRNPLYTNLADKYWVKKYVARLIGEEHVVPCYGHWKRLQDIDFKNLPERFFMKMNHDSTKGVVVDQKKGIDMDRLRQVFSDLSLKRNWYWTYREWPYKNIEPCILADKLLDNGQAGDLQDYKFWCFNGKPIYMYITNKGENIMENFYDMDFRPADINHGFPRRMPEFDRLQCFDLMKELAAKLSAGIPFVRIDFFEVGGKVFFGEFTFYDWAGMRPFVSDELDIKLGNLIDLTDVGK